MQKFSTAATKSSALTAFCSVSLLNVLQGVRLRWPPVVRLVRSALSPLRDDNLCIIRVIKGIILVSLLTIPTTLHGQEPRVNIKVVIATYTESLISIDGSLTEPAWAAAQPATGFTQKDPSQGEPATEWTEVRVLYDDKNIYISAYCHDRTPGRIVVHDITRDFEWFEEEEEEDLGFSVVNNWLDQDFFGFQLDTFNDNRNGFLMVTTPKGGQRDAQIFNEGRDVNFAWVGDWEVEGRIHADGWTAEFAIPFQTLASSKEEFQVRGINFFRLIRRRNESSWWSPVPRRYGYFQISLAGELRAPERVERGGIGRRIEPARWSAFPWRYSSFQISPADELSVLQRQGQGRGGPAAGEEPETNLKVKLYSLTGLNQFRSQGLQTEGVFDGGVDVKYNLSSGLTLDLTLNPNFSFVEVDVKKKVNLTKIPNSFPEKREFFRQNSGLFRLGETYRLGPRRKTEAVLFRSRLIGLSDKREPIPIWGGARLTGRVGPYYLVFLNVQTRSEDAVPAHNFTVARVKRDMLANSDVGVLFINRQSEQPDDYNRTFGADLNFQFFTDLKFNAVLAKTVTPGRRGKDGMATVEMKWQSNLFRLLGSYSDIGKNFNPEVGLVRRTGRRIIHTEMGLSARLQQERSVGSFIRDIFPLLISDYTILPNGQTEVKLLRPQLEIKLQDGGGIETRYVQNFKRADRRPYAICLPKGDYRFNEFQVRYFTDKSKVLSVETQYKKCDVLMAEKKTLTVGWKLQPSTRLNIRGDYVRNKIELQDGFVATYEVGLQMKFTLSPKMFLNALIRYNSGKTQVDSHIRFHLIHRSSSDLFFVYNEQQDIEQERTDRVLALKYTYLFDF